MASFSNIKLPDLYFHNTLKRKKQRFVPLKENCVSMYTCGPTVYNYAHIGNLRTYVFEDILRRTLKTFGYSVNQVMNLTDVDDKTIKGATKSGQSLDDFTKVYKQAFFEDLKTLAIEKVEHYPAATDYIEPMIAFIEDLIKKGYAYVGGDSSVYYSIKKFSNYGCLSHFCMDQLQQGASKRVVCDEYEKDDLCDFVLWKAYDSQRDGKIYWDSPFGRGRPGWHLECSTMAINILGHTLDIHVGGVDNIFPHHENEIAQSEAFSEKPFARYWMHSEHLLVENKKMSKSAGNFYTLRDLLNQGYTGRQLRFLLLQTHYKTQLNFTHQSLDAVSKTLERVDDFVYRLKQIELEGLGCDVDKVVEKVYIDFLSALADDLNISVALAALFELIKEINALCDAGKIFKKQADIVLHCLHLFDQVFAFIFWDESAKVPLELEELLKKRNQARQEKNWPEADRLRDFIAEKGYLIEDGSEGSRLKKK